ncbi:MAG TPA: hypothetical protein VIC06_03960 [Solirubrobacteraceae bacterium]
MSVNAPPVAPETRVEARESRSDSHGTQARWLALISALVCLALLVAQIASGWHILHSSGFYTALVAHKYVWANALAAVLVAVLAIAAPGRWRWLAVLGPGAYLLAILLATAIPGGQALALIVAILTMTALWDTGERLLRNLGADALARIVPVAWLAGIGPWSIATLAFGRISLVKWWTVGIVLVLVGAIGSVRLGARLLAQRRSIAGELQASSVSLASAGLILLTCGWAAIYTAAPELQYDALYGKAYLPELWARTGHIGLIVQHVQDAVTGWFQVLATNGDLFGATAIGRYLQLIGLMSAVAVVWWWGRRHGALGPLAAVAVAVTPHLFWQASTADDDLLLALCAFALCIAVVESLRTYTGRDVRGVAFALGLMAGSGPSLKLHMVPLFAFLLLGWVAAGRASKSVLRRFGYAAIGAAITGLPPLILRWIDAGNPVLPAYNNIFHSKYWPPINEQANFPFWQHPGTFGPIDAIWKAVAEPTLMAEVSPPGAFGVLVGATVLAVLLGWLGRDRAHAARVVWIALLPAILLWWLNFRYLRYLLPISLVSVALVLMLTSGVTFGARGRLLGIVAVTLAVIASFPVTIAQFWNVPTHKPPVYAAIGRWKASSYENAALLERPAILAYNRLAPHDARAITTAYERVWLKPERDFYNIHYEVMPLMKLNGPTPIPTTGDQAFADLRRLGIEWALVTDVDRLLNEPGYLSQVLTTHGKIEFAERGWDLYRLVARPPRSTPLSACDAGGNGVQACWGLARTNDLTVSVTRTVPVCPGETLAVTVKQAAGGSPSPVLVQFIGGSAENGIQPGQTVPGLPQHIYATAPPGASSAAVTISPLAGSSVTAASIGRFGPPCAAAPRDAPR